MGNIKTLQFDGGTSCPLAAHAGGTYRTGKYNSLIWSAHVDATNLYVYTNPAATPTDSYTSQHSYAIGTASSGTFIRVWDDNIFAASNGDDGKIYISYSLDGGSNWTDFSITGTNRLYILDFMNFSTGVQILTTDATTHDLEAYNLAAALVQTIGTTIFVSAGIGQGCSYDDVYYFHYEKDPIGPIYFASVTATTSSEVIETRFTLTSLSYAIIYIIWKNGEICLDENRLYVKDRYTGLFHEESHSPVSNTTGFTWEYDSDGNYAPTKIQWDDKIYLLFGNGLAFLDDAYVGSAYSATGWDDWILGKEGYTYKLFYFEPTDLSIPIIRIEGDYPTLVAPSATMTTIGKVLVENQYILIYDSAGVKYMEGFATFVASNAPYYKYSIMSAIGLDLQIPLNVSFTTQNIPYMIKYVIDNYCAFLTYSATSISTTPTNTYSMNFNGNTVLDFFAWASNQAGYLITWDADKTVYYQDSANTPTNSQTLTDAFFTGQPSIGTQNAQVSIVIGYGAINPLTGKRRKATAVGINNYGLIIRFWPAANSDVMLQEAVDNVLTLAEVTLNLHACSVVNKSFMRPGTTYTLTDAGHSITAETYFVKKFHFNLISKVNSVEGTDIFYIPNRTVSTTDIIQFVENTSVALHESFATGDLSATENPTDGDGVGNRDYNDARYVQPADLDAYGDEKSLVISGMYQANWTYIRRSGNTSSQTYYFIVPLPAGAKITRVDFFYISNGNASTTIYLRKQRHYSTESTIYSTTDSTPNSIRQWNHTDYTVEAGYYAFYQMTMARTSGTYTYVYPIRVYYRLPVGN